MNNKLLQWIYGGSLLLIVILLFTIFDYYSHSLSDLWSVPEYYFRNKIPAGFLLGVLGLFLARNVQNVWWKSFVVSATIAVILQIRYYIEGYAPSFVFVFLLIHFVILYLLVSAMFLITKKIPNMKNLIIVFLVLAVIGAATYYIVFKDQGEDKNNQEYIITPAVQSSAVTVDIKDFVFAPATLTVQKGTKVTWINGDGAPHTVTSLSGGVLNSPNLSFGESFSFTFEEAGTFDYKCAIHPMMRGVVIVE